MEKELPVRKKIRLDGYDYSQAGYYLFMWRNKNTINKSNSRDVEDGGR